MMRTLTPWVVGVIAWIGWYAVASSWGTLHTPLPLIIALAAAGLFHLGKAVQSTPGRPRSSQLWQAVAAAAGAAFVFLFDRLLGSHDRGGHWAWLFLIVWFVALVRAEKDRDRPNAPPKPTPGLAALLRAETREDGNNPEPTSPDASSCAAPDAADRS